MGLRVRVTLTATVRPGLSPTVSWESSRRAPEGTGSSAAREASCLGLHLVRVRVGVGVRVGVRVRVGAEGEG